MALTEDEKKRIQEEEKFRAETRAKEEAKLKKPGLVRGCLNVLIVLVILLVVLSAAGKSMSSTPKKEVAVSQPKPQVSVYPSVQSTPLPAEPTSSWNYSESKDKMTGSVTKFAIVQSTNEIELDFPYGGKQKATLIIRKHPRHGNDVILSIERGQFLCQISKCTASVKFGDKGPVSITMAEPQDHSSTTLFVANADSFINKVKGSRKVLVEIVIYQAGNKVFEFDTQDLKW